MDKTTALIAKHEGYRRHPYQDSVGKWTVGIGRNLEDVGISRAEAEAMLATDITHAYAEAQSFDFFETLNEPRQAVIINMLFNLGLPKFKGFKKTIMFIEKGLFNAAGDEMLDSKWARQVKGRAIELSHMMKSGDWPDERFS